MSWIAIKMPDDEPESADPFAFVYPDKTAAGLAVVQDVIEDHEVFDVELTLDMAAQRLNWVTPTTARCMATEITYTLHEVTIK